MRLFHFSDDPAIAEFTPRPVKIPSERGPGREWLNGPLVWAINEAFQAMYLFPRDCPRIVLFRKPDSTPEDLARWFGDGNVRAVAHIERDWLERVSTTSIHRYEFPAAPFEDIKNAGYFVSRMAVTPLRMETFHDLPGAMSDLGVELRVLDRLTPLRDVWSTSLHASGIRLRNARDWA